MRVASGSPYAAAIGFSAAVSGGPWIVTAGMTAVAADGTVVGSGPYEQAVAALHKVRDAVQAAGGQLADVVQTRIYLVDAAHWSEVGRAHGELFGAIRPAATMVVVAALLDPRMLVEIEAVAYRGLANDRNASTDGTA